MRKKTGARHFGLSKRFSPAKGTKRRALLVLCLRTQGVSTREGSEATGIMMGTICSEVTRLFDDYGYDIRAFGIAPVRYVLVGKYEDNKYWDFTRFRKLDL